MPLVRAYGASLAALGRGRIAAVGSLVLLGAAVEGVGIVLLIPLLGLVFAARSAPSSHIGRVAEQAMADLEPGSRLAVLLAAFSALVVVRGIILWRRDLGIYALSLELVDRWRTRLLDALARASWHRLQALHRGHVEFTVTADVSRLSLGSDRLLRGVVGAIQCVVLGALAIALSPLLSLSLVALLLLFLPIGLRAARASYDFGADLTRQGGKRHNAMTEFMAGLKLAKAHDAEDRYAREFAAIGDMLRTRALDYMDGQLRGRNLFQIAAAILAAALLLIGIQILRLPPAILSAVLVLVARLSGPVLQLGQGAQSLMTMLPALDNLLMLERSLAEDVAAPTGPAVSLHATGPAAVALRGVGFRHPVQADDVLKGIDLSIEAGELVALVGASGSGKTTLADILIGLAAPQSGSLLVDGAEIAGPEALSAWRRRIGYVPQDPFLFDRTLLENMRWAQPEASEAEVWQALEMAEAAEFVRALPGQLVARAGDRGSHLSGGERQRLCLARALLRAPRLLVLDEATNALDQGVELKMLETLAGLRGRMTILLITHRLPDSFPVDRVLHLAGGRL